MTKKDFASRDTKGTSAAREAMAARYATSVDPTVLPTGQVAHDPLNLRAPEDYRGQSISELAASMRYVGVLEVLGIVRREVYLVRHPDQESEIGGAPWVVVYGNRRLAAALEAKLTEVPVRVVDQLDEQDRTRESRLIENIHHVDLDPLIEGYEVKDLVALHGKKGQVAEILGKSPGWVSQRLALANLVPQLQAELKAGRLKLENARALGAIAQVRQLEAWQSGPPYRDPAKTPPAPAPDVVPGQTETYTRTEVPAVTPENGRATSSEAAIGATKDGAPEFYDVKNDAPHQDHRQDRQNEENEPETAHVTLSPGPLANLLRERLSQEQRAELIRLLQD